MASISAPSLLHSTLLFGSHTLHPPSSSSLQSPQPWHPSHRLSIRLRNASPFLLSRTGRLRIQAADTATAEVSESIKPAITLTERALKHLRKLRTDVSEDLCLRIGVRQGGCSGMSYTMDFEQRANVRPDDSIIDHEGFIMVCDPKSLLFLFGMQLDYSDALIGGGFSFSNPNASMTCGCGKSFAA